MNSTAEDNFRHGVETYKRKQEKFRLREYRQNELNANLMRLDMGRRHEVEWTREQLETMWCLRYEKTPKATYDQLARKFKRINTWDIVNVLCTMQSRRKSGLDPFEAIVRTSPEQVPQKPPLPKPKSRKIIRRRTSVQVQDYCRMRGQGYTAREIGVMYGKSGPYIQSCFTRMMKIKPEEYNRLVEEGRRMKKK